MPPAPHLPMSTFSFPHCAQACGLPIRRRRHGWQWAPIGQVTAILRIRPHPTHSACFGREHDAHRVDPPLRVDPDVWSRQFAHSPVAGPAMALAVVGAPNDSALRGDRGRRRTVRCLSPLLVDDLWFNQIVWRAFEDVAQCHQSVYAQPLRGLRDESIHLLARQGDTALGEMRREI